MALANVLAHIHSDVPVDMIRLRQEGEEDAAREAISTVDALSQPAPLV